MTPPTRRKRALRRTALNLGAPTYLLRELKWRGDTLGFAQQFTALWILRDLKDEAIHPWRSVYVSEIHRQRPQRVPRLERKTDPNAIHGKPWTRLRPCARLEALHGDVLIHR